MDKNNLKENELNPDKQSGNKEKYRKCIYISEEVHKKLSSLIRALVESGNENLTIGAFANSIIKEFMEKRKKDINEIYRQDRGDLI